jgi:biofilm PGA synthesis N-glycosyltransferase PgaC
MATAIFVLSVAFVLYAIVLYPLILILLVRISSRPVQGQPCQPGVSVLLAVRNGEQWIRDKLESILKLDYPRDLLQIIVISDGSTDRTDEMVGEFASSGIDLVRIPQSGKAAALNAGIGRARGEILFFTDVRQRLEPECLQSLVSYFADPSVGAVSGELVILEGEKQQEADVGLYWRYEKWIRRRLSQIDSVLGTTGCIYAMRRELAVELPANTLLDDVYLPLAAFFAGYRVVLDENAKAFDLPTPLDTEFRRKVRTLAGVYQIIRAYPGLLGPSNRMWIHFLSHKVARLLLPYALIALAISSFGLTEPWRQLALWVQAAFYGLAATDLLIPESWLLKRLSSPARTFVILITAALCAASILFRPHSNLWKETRVSAARQLP